MSIAEDPQKYVRLLEFSNWSNVHSIQMMIIDNKIQIEVDWNVYKIELEGMKPPTKLC